jgi:hypothetical protein
MDICVTDRPELLPVAGDAGHASACHLPRSAVGPGAEAEQLRAEAVRKGRHTVVPFEGRVASEDAVPAGGAI